MIKQWLRRFILTVLIGTVFTLVGVQNILMAATLNSALDRYNIGDYRGAIEQWEHLARMGNPDALFNLGQVYRLGSGVDMDMAKVEYFYRRAAESGHVEAQNNLATIYYFDESSTSRRGEALTWWRLAARHGHGASQYMLAVLHYNGETLPKDNIQAFAWVVLAREAGVEAAIIAERVMRRNLSVNEMSQGRLLSRGLVEQPTGNRGLQVTIPDPQGIISNFPDTNPPLVLDAPATPPQPPSATMAAQTPSSPPAPSAPPVAREARERPARPVATTLPRLSGWSLQMGSFRSVDNPNALYARMQAEHADLMSGLEAQVAEADLGERGIFYRLLIGSFANKEEAMEHCQTLKGVGYNCFAVAP